jgi:hypothetical protein
MNSRKLHGILREVLANWRFPDWTAPLALLAACLLCYALLIPRLGFYWDDVPIQWIASRMGSAGLERYFATNRPLWGFLYQLTTPVLGSTPWHWQMFALFWRWVAAVALWGVLRLTFRRQSQPALWVALLFAVYPGFGQQFISLVYSHFFIVLSAFLASLACMLLAVRQPRRFHLWTVLGLLLSLLNLVTMEYFFLLELLRPALLWIALADSFPTPRLRLRQIFLAWLPYLLLFLGAGVWRAFFFPYQTQNYQARFLNQLAAAPLQATFGLLARVIRDLWIVTLGSLGHALRLPDAAVLGNRTTWVYALLVAFTSLTAALFLWLSPATTSPLRPLEVVRLSQNALRWLRSRFHPDHHKDVTWALPCLLTGLLGLLAAGGPYWLTGIPVGLEFPKDRFTLSFMPGACLFLAGLLGLLPTPRWTKLGLLALLLGFSIGVQFQNANAYRRDWSTQRSLFQQLTWRAPALQPGTTLLFNDVPLRFYSDNSLTGALNELYSFGDPHTQMAYMLYFPSLRLGAGLPALQPGLEIDQNYLAAEFHGNTSQMAAINFNPPGCLRILDPDLDPLNWMLPVTMREAARLSTTSVILPSSTPARLNGTIYGDQGEPGGWCYLFELAELARQQGDWERVALLGDQAFALDDHPNDPNERIVFIEGYAHTARWSDALEQNRAAADITPAMQPMLCRLWQRIRQNTPTTSAQTDAIRQAQQLLACPP